MDIAYYINFKCMAIYFYLKKKHFCFYKFFLSFAPQIEKLSYSSES